MREKKRTNSNRGQASPPILRISEYSLALPAPHLCPPAGTLPRTGTGSASQGTEFTASEKVTQGAPAAEGLASGIGDVCREKRAAKASHTSLTQGDALIVLGVLALIILGVWRSKQKIVFVRIIVCSVNSTPPELDPREMLSNDAECLL